MIVCTCCRKPKMSASNLCIYSTPEVITHSAPLSIKAHLNTALTVIGSTNQSDASNRTSYETNLELPYSRKYWRSIKFGSLAVGEVTVKFKSVKFKCDLRTYVLFYTCVCMHIGTTAKFKSANIFISAARDQTAKFKDRQFFRLYSIDVCVNGSGWIV